MVSADWQPQSQLPDFRNFKNSFHSFLQSRPVVDVFDLNIFEVVHDLDFQIREMIHFLPFAALIGKMIDFLYFQVFKMLDNFYLNIREMIYELYSAIELFSVIGAVRSNFSFQGLRFAACAKEKEEPGPEISITGRDHRYSQGFCFLIATRKRDRSLAEFDCLWTGFETGFSA